MTAESSGFASSPSGNTGEEKKKQISSYLNLGFVVCMVVDGISISNYQWVLLEVGDKDNIVKLIVMILLLHKCGYTKIHFKK